jgi:uncharacterized membrane protein YidH (DUF202 family)
MGPVSRPCERAWQDARDDEPGTEDATRRTFLAQERTLPAWWRSGLAALAVAVSVRRLVPSLLHVAAPPFLTLGVCFGVLGILLRGGIHQEPDVQRRLRKALTWGQGA